MHNPMSALVYLRAKEWNLIEHHPMAFPLDFSSIIYRRTSGSSPFRSFSHSASRDTIDFTWSGWERESIMSSSSFCHFRRDLKSSRSGARSSMPFPLSIRQTRLGSSRQDLIYVHRG